MRFYMRFRIIWCYTFLLAWLGILLLYLSYWKIEADNYHPVGPLPQGENDHHSMTAVSDDKHRHRKARVYCNAPERIRLGHEGEVPSEYSLVGVVIAFRHGDRGPLITVQNMSSINCGHKSYGTPLYKKFSATILNASKTNSYINFVGPFMKYPLLPTPSKCSLGNLTPLGVMQHIQLGKVLKSLYVKKLSLLSYPWEIGDLSAHCTKYRRTFQSTLAFLYGFLPTFDLNKLHLKDDRQLNFCGDYCQCRKAAAWEVLHEKEKIDYRKSHPSVLELVSSLNPIVKASSSFEDFKTPYAMRDALLAYSCHGSKFPCLGGKCVGFDDLSKLLSFEEWEARQRATINQVKSSKLRIYGLMKSILDYIRLMIQNGSPKVVLFAGHDKTINYLLTSFGLSHFQPPVYASRVIFEVYANISKGIDPSAVKSTYLFRLIYNGKDLTKLLPFCHVTVVKKVTSSNMRMSDMTLCQVRELELYLEDGKYFKEFNTTNFRDACDE